MVDTDGFFDPDITPETIAAGIAHARDMSVPTEIGSLWAQTERYFARLPWTGGRASLF